MLWNAVIVDDFWTPCYFDDAQQVDSILKGHGLSSQSSGEKDQPTKTALDIMVHHQSK